MACQLLCMPGGNSLLGTRQSNAVFMHTAPMRGDHGGAIDIAHEFAIVGTADDGQTANIVIEHSAHGFTYRFVGIGTSDIGGAYRIRGQRVGR